MTIGVVVMVDGDVSDNGVLIMIDGSYDSKMMWHNDELNCMIT